MSKQDRSHHQGPRFTRFVYLPMNSQSCLKNIFWIQIVILLVLLVIAAVQVRNKRNEYDLAFQMFLDSISAETQKEQQIQDK